MSRLIITAAVTLILTGCAGWTWEDEMRYQAGGSGAAYSAPAAAPAATPEQTVQDQQIISALQMGLLEQQRQTWLMQQQANKRD